MNRELVDKIKVIILPIVNQMGYELVDVEFLYQGALVLRIYIDKDKGISVGDCEQVSRRVSDILDAENFVDKRYCLEVSSPGLDRRLNTIQDFKRFCGQVVTLQTLTPIDGRSNYKGKIENVSEEKVYIKVDGKDYEIDISNVAKANLVPIL